jgi:predicted DCC family thiol-disulfide oxidoreductase YuxK
MNILSTFKKSFSLDTRSLALYRILLGFLVMCDVVYRLPDLTNFYTDVGLVPRAQFISEMAMPWSFSLHLANGSLGFAVIMFGIHFILGLMLMTGYKSRWAAIGCYVMAVSVHNRNWLVNNGGDDVMRAMLFFSIFLPMNRVMSVDSAISGKDSEEKEFFSTWGFCFYLQAFLIYFVSYVLKDHPIWREDFTAVFYSSRLDIFATPFGLWLRNFPTFQKASTIFTILMEWGGPIALLGAFLLGKNWWKLRLGTVVLFLMLHGGIAATMWIGLFPYICMTLWLIFLPGEVWERMAAHYRRLNFGKLSLYYDGECNFCLKMVRILREFFLLQDVRIYRTQDFPQIQSLMLKENSWVVVNETGQRFFHWNGMVEALKHSPILRVLAPVFSVPVILDFSNRVYKWVASHRQVMSKMSQFFEYKTMKRVQSFFWINEVLGAFFFMTLLMWNLTTIKRWGIQSPFFQDVTRVFHFYQEWNMFAPFPKRDNVWVEIPAELMDGSQVELLTGDRDIYSIKRDAFPKTVKNEHWRKFFLNLQGRDDYARYYGGYLCREWNIRRIRWVPQQRLRKFEITMFSQMNFPDGSTSGISKVMSWHHYCFKEDRPKGER